MSELLDVEFATFKTALILNPEQVRTKFTSILHDDVENLLSSDDKKTILQKFSDELNTKVIVRAGLKSYSSIHASFVGIQPDENTTYVIQITELKQKSKRTIKPIKIYENADNEEVMDNETKKIIEKVEVYDKNLVKDVKIYTLKSDGNYSIEENVYLTETSVISVINPMTKRTIYQIEKSEEYGIMVKKFVTIPTQPNAWIKNIRTNVQLQLDPIILLTRNEESYVDLIEKWKIYKLDYIE